MRKNLFTDTKAQMAVIIMPKRNTEAPVIARSSQETTDKMPGSFR